MGVRILLNAPLRRKFIGWPEENVFPFAFANMLFYNFVFIVSLSIMNNISLLLAMWTSCLIHSFRLDHILQPYTFSFVNMREEPSILETIVYAVLCKFKIQTI